MTGFMESENSFAAQNYQPTCDDCGASMVPYDGEGELLVTAQQVADALGLPSAHTVKKLRKDGRLSGVKVNGQYLYPASLVLMALDAICGGGEAVS